MGFKQWLRSKLEEPKIATPDAAAAIQMCGNLKAMIEADHATLLKLRDGLVHLQGNLNRVISRSEAFFHSAFAGKPFDRQNHAAMLMSYLAYDQFIQAMGQYPSLEARVDAGVKWNEAQKQKPFPIIIHVEDINIGPFVKRTEDEAPRLPWSQVVSLFGRLPSTIFAQTYIKDLYGVAPPVLLPSGEVVSGSASTSTEVTN